MAKNLTLPRICYLIKIGENSKRSLSFSRSSRFFLFQFHQFRFFKGHYQRNQIDPTEY